MLAPVKKQVLHAVLKNNWQAKLCRVGSRRRNLSGKQDLNGAMGKREGKSVVLLYRYISHFFYCTLSFRRKDVIDKSFYFGSVFRFVIIKQRPYDRIRLVFGMF